MGNACTNCSACKGDEGENGEILTVDNKVSLKNTNLKTYFLFIVRNQQVKSRIDCKSQFL